MPGRKNTPETLILATNSVRDDFEQRLADGKHHRLDYLELAKHLPADFLDYRHTPPLLRPLDDRLRNDLGLAVVAANIIRKHGYTSVFAWSEQIGLPLSILKRFGFVKRSVKLTTMFHCPLLLPRLMVYQATGALGVCDKLVFLSEAEAEEFNKRLKVAPEKISVVHTPHDTTFYKPLVPAEPRVRGDFLFSIGVAERDYPTLIQAMENLPEIGCKISATSTWDRFGGGFGKRPRPENVKIEHFTDPVAVRNQCSQARFIVTPIKKATVNWTAGCTSATLAGAMGKAIVISDSPGLREYVIDGETGILVEPGNPESLAEAIEYLWNNPQEASRMGAAGRRNIQEHFSLPTWVDKLAGVLTSSMPLGTPAPALRKTL